MEEDVAVAMEEDAALGDRVSDACGRWERRGE